MPGRFDTGSLTGASYATAGSRRPLASFLAAYPDVSLHIVTSNAPVDLIEQRVDVALRVRFSLEGDASLTMRALASSRRILVATPLVAAQVEGENDPECLACVPCLAFGADDMPEVWRLLGPLSATAQESGLPVGDLGGPIEGQPPERTASTAVWPSDASVAVAAPASRVRSQTFTGVDALAGPGRPAKAPAITRTWPMPSPNAASGTAAAAIAW